MSRPIRILVADDEPLARSGIRQLVAHDADLTLVGECAHGRATVEAIRELDPDLVLLDVQMPELDGFEVIREVGPDRMPWVVFVTAHDQFAVRAFAANALDYLVKPFDDERFRSAMDRAKRALAAAEAKDLGRRLAALLGGLAPAGLRTPRAGEGASPPHPDRLVVRERGRSILVRVGELDWIEAADYYVRLHVGKHVYLLRETLTALEQALDPARFVRVHRSAIVNLDRVREIQPYFHDEHVLILQDGARVRLSRSGRIRLESTLGHRL